MNRDQVRALVLTNIAAPYRVELFRHSYRAFDQFHVAFQSDMEPGRKWHCPTLPFESSLLNSVRINIGGRSILWTRGVAAKIRELDPAVVVASGFGPTLPSVIRECRRNGRKLILLNDGTPETDPLSGPEYFYRRWLVRAADGFIGACQRAAEYFRLLGAVSTRVEVVELTTDLLAIRKATNAGELRRRARAQWGTGPHVVCAVGKLVPGKRMLDAIKAYTEASGSISGLSLLIAGEGPLEGELRSYLEEHHISGVQLLGHLEWQDMLALYAASDLLLFPAVRERFGMVIIEALASGVPVIATQEAGATHDLIRDGENGFVVAPGDVSQMAACMMRYFGSPGLATAMTSRAMDVVEAHDVRIEAERFTSYVRELSVA